MKVYFVAVKGMDGMVGRHAAKHGAVGPRKIPFECKYDTLEEFETALKAGPVVGSQLIYERIPGSWRANIINRVMIRIIHENCVTIRESEIEFLDPPQAR